MHHERKIKKLILSIKRHAAKTMPLGHAICRKLLWVCLLSTCPNTSPVTCQPPEHSWLQQYPVVKFSSTFFISSEQTWDIDMPRFLLDTVSTNRFRSLFVFFYSVVCLCKQALSLITIPTIFCKFMFFRQDYCCLAFNMELLIGSICCINPVWHKCKKKCP